MWVYFIIKMNNELNGWQITDWIKANAHGYRVILRKRKGESIGLEGMY